MNRFWELVKVFARLGTVGFGGPQAHIAMQNDEAVVRRQWLTPEQFSEGIAICEMLPGPASTQLGIYIGYLRGGYLGALVAGIAFIAPAYLIVVLLSWIYFKFQTVPQWQAIFTGIAPVVVAVILAFCWKLGRKTIKDGYRAGIAIGVFAATVLPHYWSLMPRISTVWLFIMAAIIGLILFGPKGWGRSPDLRAHWLLGWILTTAPADWIATVSFWGWPELQSQFWPLCLFFLKVGSAVFGGGLVIIPFIQGEVVDQLGWLTESEFIDGVAIGQLSPGPVVLTAAFIGYKVAGLMGSLVATVSIFAPSFGFIMVASPLMHRGRQNAWVKGALQGITPAALGAIAGAAIPMGQQALLHEAWVVTGCSVLILAGSLVGLLRYKLPTWQLVPAGAIAGILIGQLV